MRSAPLRTWAGKWLHLSLKSNSNQTSPVPVGPCAGRRKVMYLLALTKAFPDAGSAGTKRQPRPLEWSNGSPDEPPHLTANGHGGEARAG